jgi:hypothetical protein
METHFHSLTYVQAPVTALMKTHCELQVEGVLANHGTAKRQKVEGQMCCFPTHNLHARYITFNKLTETGLFLISGK